MLGERGQEGKRGRPEGEGGEATERGEAEASVYRLDHVFSSAQASWKYLVKRVRARRGQRAHVNAQSTRVEGVSREVVGGHNQLPTICWPDACMSCSRSIVRRAFRRHL